MEPGLSRRRQGWLLLLGAAGLVAGLALLGRLGVLAPPPFRGVLDVGAGRAAVHVDSVRPRGGGHLVLARVPRGVGLRLQASLLGEPRALGSLSARAEQLAALTAINGDYHQLEGPDRYLPSGIFVAGGVARVSTGSRCSFWIGAEGAPRIGRLDLSQTTPVLALGSGPRLLLDGELAPGLAEVELPGYTHRHPRAAIGLNREAVWLVASYHEPRGGLALRDLAEALRELGCRDALALDGGPSATLWVRTGLRAGVAANVPVGSGGSEPDLASGLFVLPSGGGGVELR